MATNHRIARILTAAVYILAAVVFLFILSVPATAGYADRMPEWYCHIVTGRVC